MLLPIRTDSPLTHHFTSKTLATGHPIRRILMVGALPQATDPDILSSLDEKYLTDTLHLLSDDRSFTVTDDAEISICNPAYGSDFLTDEIQPEFDLVGFCNIDVPRISKDGEQRWFNALLKTRAAAVFNARTTDTIELDTAALNKPPYKLVARTPLFLGHLDVLTRS